MAIIFNIVHDNHVNLIDAQNRELAARNRILKQIELQEQVPNYDWSWTTDDEPIII